MSSRRIIREIVREMSPRDRNFVSGFILGMAFDHDWPRPKDEEEAERQINLYKDYLVKQLRRAEEMELAEKEGGTVES